MMKLGILTLTLSEMLNAINYCCFASVTRVFKEIV